MKNNQSTPKPNNQETSKTITGNNSSGHNNTQQQVNTKTNNNTNTNTNTNTKNINIANNNTNSNVKTIQPSTKSSVPNIPNIPVPKIPNIPIPIQIPIFKTKEEEEKANLMEKITPVKPTEQRCKILFTYNIITYLYLVLII